VHNHHVVDLAGALHSPKSEVADMLGWATVFLVIAIVAALFGFTGFAAASAGIAKFIFFVFLIVFVVTLFMGYSRRAP
jgi:uncharacterized membrane protein YtjA (UPF0391 family)